MNMKNACNLETHRTTTIIIAKFIDLDNGLINSHKHRIGFGIDKISYSMS